MYSVLFCFLPTRLCCPLRLQNSPQTCQWEGFLLFGNFSFMTPSPGQVSILNSCVSLFVFYILSYLLSKRMGCLSGCLVYSTSVQKLFCGSCSAFKWSLDEFVGEKVVSPSYSSAILNFLSYSYLLDVNPSSVISFASIFSHFVSCLSILSVLAFAVKWPLDLIRYLISLSLLLFFSP